MKLFRVLAVLLLPSCAQWEKDFTSCNAESFGGDWVVVQIDMNGNAFRCWELHNVSITNETASDGIYWQGEDGNLVHISGLYNRVQVSGDQFESALHEVGISNEAQCIAIHDRRQE